MPKLIERATVAVAKMLQKAHDANDGVNKFFASVSREEGRLRHQRYHVGGTNGWAGCEFCIEEKLKKARAEK